MKASHWVGRSQQIVAQYKAPIKERAPCRGWFPARCRSTLTLFAWDTVGHCTVVAVVPGGTLFGGDTVIHCTVVGHSLAGTLWDTAVWVLWLWDTLWMGRYTVVGHYLAETRKQRKLKTVNCQLLSYLTVTSFIFATIRLITQLLLDIFLKTIWQNLWF